MFKQTDEDFLAYACRLASYSEGSQSPNPQVGAVLVYQGRILGQGYHAKAGQAHAEVLALRAVAEADRHLIPQSCLYVSLEPCFHHGRTPPCVDLIIREKIPRVVIGQTDPFAKVSGQSIARLQSLGVEVVLAPPRPYLDQIHARFFTNVQKQRPYLILKWAESANHQLGLNQTISGPLSQRLVHRWRSQEAAILVGSQTLLSDNPQLNNRLYPALFAQQPLRLVLDRQGRLKNHHHKLAFFQNQDQQTSLWLSEIQANLPCLKTLKPKSTWKTIFQMLYQEYQLSSILIEGGSQILHSLIHENLWDEIRLFRNPKLQIQGSPPAPPTHNLQAKQIQNLGQDQLHTFINPQPH